MEQCGDGKAQMLKDGHIFREVDSNLWDPQKRIEECDLNNVDVQVISTVPVMFSYWADPDDALDLSKFLNDHIGELAGSFPNRFAGLGTVPLQDPGRAVDELDRCMTKLQLDGIQIGTNIDGTNLSDPGLFPVFEAADDLGAAILVHPWSMMAEDEMTKYWLPWLVGMPAETSRAICSLIFGGVLERLPNLRIAFAHGGGSFPAAIGRISHGYNIRPDLCAIDNDVDPLEYLGKFWVDSLVHDEETFHFLCKKIGDDKIALGSDYPFPLGEEIPGELIRSLNTYPQETKEKFLGVNALDWLGKKEEEFRG